MKIADLIYKTPEMTEEKLLTIIDKNYKVMVGSTLRSRLRQLHKDIDLCKAFLDEYDLIQDKKSFLTKSQRDMIIGFIGICMIEMTKDDGTTGK